MGGRSEVGIVLLGLGVVGSGVARALLEKADSFTQRAGGRSLFDASSSAMSPRTVVWSCRRACSRMTPRRRSRGLRHRRRGDGRRGPGARLHPSAASQPAARVVTANKEVMAKHGASLLSAGQRDRARHPLRGQRRRRHPHHLAPQARPLGQRDHERLAPSSTARPTTSSPG